MASEETEKLEFELSTQSPLREEQKELKLYFLIIEIIKASNLIKADFGIGQTSDPFITVTGNHQSYTTKVIMNNLNPEFNEKTSFCFLEPVKELYFEVWNHNQHLKHDQIGHCTLDVSHFFEPNNQGFKGNLKLEKVKSGDINVVVQGRLVKPVELENRCKEMAKTKEENEKKIAEKQRDLDVIAKENESLQETLNKLQDEQTKLDLTVTQYEEAKHDAESSIQTLENKIFQSQNDTQVFQTQIQATKSEIENLDKEITKQESQYKTKKTQKDNILQEMESIRSKLVE